MKKILDIKKLESLRKALQFKDRGIFEKTVYAFNLLSELLQFYPHLVFKGGTSILLHIFPPARLSIDIDILLPEKERSSLKDTLVKMTATSEWFDSVEEDIRKKEIPKAHYKFQFVSQFSKVPQYVLLDVVFVEHSYKKLVEKDMSKVPLVFLHPDVLVLVPTPEGLLGDKITAASPNTIGIPLNEMRAMEVIKQVIDLGELFNVADDLDDVRKSFFNTAKQENAFRKTTHSIDNILEDVTDIAFKYSQSLLKGADNSYSEIALINDGLDKVANHLVRKIGHSEVKVAFAKIAYLASVLKKNNSSKFQKMMNMSLIQEPVFPEKYMILKRLKVINPEAYFYWAMSFIK